MKKKLFSRSERGQSLVETAFTLMLILWLLAGAVDFGMGYFSYVAIRDAAQEGALYGSVCQTNSAIITRAQRSSNRPVNLTTTTVTVSYPAGSAAEGNPLRVQVLYNYPITTPLISMFVGSNTITIRASATSTILNNECP